MFISQFLDLDQACFRQWRLSVLGQGKPEQLPAKLSERYAELLIGVRVPAFDRASTKCCAAHGIGKPTVVRPVVGRVALHQRADNPRVGEFDERYFKIDFGRPLFKR